MAEPDPEDVEALGSRLSELSSAVGVAANIQSNDHEPKKRGWRRLASAARIETQRAVRKGHPSDHNLEAAAPRPHDSDPSSTDDGEDQAEAALREERYQLVRENRTLLSEAKDIRAIKRHTKAQSSRTQEINQRLDVIADRLLLLEGGLRLELSEESDDPEAQQPLSAPSRASAQPSFASPDASTASNVNRTQSARPHASSNAALMPDAAKPEVLSMNAFNGGAAPQGEGESGQNEYSSESVQAVISKTKEKLALRQEKIASLENQTQAMSEDASNYLSTTKELKEHMAKKKKGWFY